MCKRYPGFASIIDIGEEYSVLFLRFERRLRDGLDSHDERGPALGAQAGEARLRSFVTEAGFTRFRRATQTPFNLVLEARA